MSGVKSVLSVIFLFLVLAASGEEKTAKTEEAVEAEKTIQERAEAGDADAQLQLGHLYESGEGVPKDFTEAAKWYRKAAEQGNAEAQLYLGCLYSIGRGVPKDFAAAYMWFSLAAAGGNKEYGELRGLLEKRMTREQLVKSQKLTGEWLERKAKEKGE